MSHWDELTSEDRQWLEQRHARLDALVEQRLAECRRTNVYVFDMFIDADDDSDGAPNLWVACDHYTGAVIQRLAGPELEDFYAEHKDWVEYSGLVDELEDQLREGVGLGAGEEEQLLVMTPTAALTTGVLE